MNCSPAIKNKGKYPLRDSTEELQVQIRVFLNSSKWFSSLIKNVFVKKHKVISPKLLLNTIWFSFGMKFPKMQVLWLPSFLALRADEWPSRTEMFGGWGCEPFIFSKRKFRACCQMFSFLVFAVLLLLHCPILIISLHFEQSIAIKIGSFWQF